MLHGMSEVTQILIALERGDAHATDQLLPLVYDELRRLAATRLAAEPPGQTLEPTALVHEAYLRLVGTSDAPGWDGRGHFFAAAAEAMRRILIENARRKKRLRHGGDRLRMELIEPDGVTDAAADEVLALDEAIARLAAEDSTAAELVKLRRYAGLSVEEAGRALRISRASAYRHWVYARAWLRDALEGKTGPTP
jgi:RNA polymerase sigma factor (TIGR02999 family)